MYCLWYYCQIDLTKVNVLILQIPTEDSRSGFSVTLPPALKFNSAVEDDGCSIQEQETNNELEVLFPWQQKVALGQFTTYRGVGAPET